MSSKFIVIVECIIERAGKFLMIKRPQGIYAGGLLAFPGGKIEIEDGLNNKNILIEAVKREVLEEVGLNLLDPIDFVTSSYFKGIDEYPILDVIFQIQLQKTSIEINTSSREVSEYYWLTKDEIASHPDTPEWVLHYLEARYQ